MKYFDTILPMMNDGQTDFNDDGVVPEADLYDFIIFIL